MPGVIAQNRIPRHRLPAHAIFQRPAGAAGGAAGTGRIGDITWAATLPVVAGATYQDALVIQPGGPMKVTDYPDLFAVQGLIAGKSFIQSPFLGNNASAASDQAYYANGRFWGFKFNALSLLMRTDPMLAYTSGLATTVNNQGFNSMRAAGSRIFAVSSNKPSNYDTFVTTITDDTTMIKDVNAGIGTNANPGVLESAAEIVPGSIYILTMQTSTTTASFLVRTTNGGTSWTSIASMTSKYWISTWFDGVNAWAMSMAGDIAKSTDQGATWAITPAASVPNTKVPLTWAGIAGWYAAIYIPKSSDTCLMLTNGGVFVTFSKSNPLAGFTNTSGGGSWSASASIAAWMFDGPNGTVGWLWTNPGQGAYLINITSPSTLVVTQICAQPPVYSGSAGGYWSGVANVMSYNGYLLFEQATSSSIAATAQQACYSADGFNTFDRYVITDPVLPSGNKPFVRVK